MEPWLCEYMANSEKAMEEILQMFDKWKDCNIPFNTTLENVVEKVRAEITLTDEVLEHDLSEEEIIIGESLYGGMN